MPQSSLDFFDIFEVIEFPPKGRNGYYTHFTFFFLNFDLIVSKQILLRCQGRVRSPWNSQEINRGNNSTQSPAERGFRSEFPYQSWNVASVRAVWIRNAQRNEASRPLSRWTTRLSFRRIA